MQKYVIYKFYNTFFYVFNKYFVDLKRADAYRLTIHICAEQNTKTGVLTVIFETYL